MKKLLFFLLLCAFPFVANAQMANADQPAKVAKNVQVDNSLMECIYHYTVIDRDLSTFREYDQILQIGDSICKYGDYGEYRLDSAMATMPVVTNREFDVLYRRYNPESDFILLHMNSNRLGFMVEFVSTILFTMSQNHKLIGNCQIVQKKYVAICVTLPLANSEVVNGKFGTRIFHIVWDLGS